MSGSLYNAKVSESYKTLLHVSDQLGADKQLVYDGNGSATSLTIGPSGVGVDVTGPVTITDGLSSGNLHIDNYNVNDVKFGVLGDSTNIEIPQTAAIGKIQVTYSSDNYQIVFGDPQGTVDLCVLEVNSTDNNFYIKRSLTDTEPPFSINRSTGAVSIRNLIVESSSDTLPVGMISDFPYLTIPSGWVECDGAKYNVVGLSALGALLSSAYGGFWSGTGVLTSFNVPDYRGVVRRTLDHVTAGGGAATGRDPQTGREIGTYQADDFKSHIHNIALATTNLTALPPGPVPALYGSGTTTLSATGGSESRMKNITVVTCIKC